MSEALVFKCGGEVLGGRPEYVNFGIGWHVLKVCLVATEPDGSPKLVSIIGKDQSVHLAGGEKFVTAYFAIAGFGLTESDISNQGVMKAVPK